MLKKTILLFLVFFISTLVVHADNWLKAYVNGGKATRSTAMLLLPGGNMIFAGISSNGESNLMITSADGAILKEQEFTKTKSINKIVYTADNNIFICGISDSMNTYGTNMFWMKLDLNLNIIWSRQSERLFNDICESGIQYSDGTYYIVGYGSRTGDKLSDRDALIYHIAENGDLLTAKISSAFGADYFNNIRELPDNSLVIIGSKIWQVEMDVFITKLTKDLTNIITKTLGGLDSEGAYDLLVDNGNIYMLGGTHSYGAGRYDVLLSKFDLNLALLSSKTFGTESNESAYSIVKMNGGISIVANFDTTNVADSVYVPTRLLIINTDMDGNYQSSVLLNKNSSINSLSSAAVSGDNELVINFTSNSFSKGNINSLVVIKTDSLKLYCCDYFIPIILETKSITVDGRSIAVSFNPAGNSIILATSASPTGFNVAKKCNTARDTSSINTLGNATYCLRENIKFTTSSSIEPISSMWIFGDTIAMIDTARDEMNFSFDSVGVFNIYYISYFECNSDTDTISIEIVNSKSYLVELVNSGNCINKPLTFNVNYSSSAIVKYHWDFGISTSADDTSNLEAPDFTFTNPGIYVIRLFSTTLCGSKADSITITIAEKIPVEIDYLASSYCKNSPVSFSVNSPSVPISTSWNFGDPTSANNSTTGENTLHSYAKSGSYICTVISDFGCNSDTDTVHVNIIDYFPTLTNIVYTGVCANEDFEFDVSNSMSNPIYNWQVDEQTGTITFPSKTFTHQFTKPGTYIVRVSIDNNNCEKGLDTLLVNVSEYTPAEIEVTNDPCLQNLMLNTKNPSTNILWKLSDGFTSTENILLHSFPISGTYDVTLYTNPNSTCSDSVTISIPFVKENTAGGIYIPEVFSPNGDGNNDYFSIDNTTNNPCRLLSFKVFDRWGKIIHSVGQNEPFTWDGKFKGTTVAPGAYIGYLETDAGVKSFIIHIVY
jgi:gliding motility-associated-like protein